MNKSALNCHNRLIPAFVSLTVFTAAVFGGAPSNPGELILLVRLVWVGVSADSGCWCGTNNGAPASGRSHMNSGTLHYW